MSTKNETPRSSRSNIVIIGAGLGGLSFGVALKRKLGFENFTIYEKAPEIGGTWRDNTYPGCSSDIPIHYYCLSTDLNPDWDRSHGLQPEIQAYWKDITRKYNLRPYIQFNSKVVSATWDTELQLYHIVIEDVRSGAKQSTTANILISAVGILHQPRYPSDLKGIESFQGDLFHSARYRHDVELKGKRVGVVGNGASACQFIPIISSDPSVNVVNFCRTPAWFVPSPRKTFSDNQKWIFSNIPYAMRAYRNTLWAMSDILFVFYQSKSLRDKLATSLESHIRELAPPEQVDTLIPSYPPFCKRIILSPGYLPALKQPNVSLNWDGIAEISEDGIVTKKGETIPLDVIILATGFIVDKYPIQIRGSNGQTVQEYYDSQGGPTAYLGTTLPGFPNFYMLGGPNTTTGHASVIFTEEVQINYSLQLIAPVLRGFARSFEVTPEATDSYNDTIQARLAKSTFILCSSWYRTGGTGKVYSIFPGSVSLFWWWSRWVYWGHYKTVGGERWVSMQRWKVVAKGLTMIAFVSGLVWSLSSRTKVVRP